MKKKSSLFKRLFVGFLIGISMVTLFGFLGSWWWGFDLFSSFRVQYFQLGLIGLGVTLWNRWHRLTIWAIALICINYALVLPFYWNKPAPSNQPTIRVMLLNVNRANQQFDLIYTHIKNADPDIVVLEEITPQLATALEKLNPRYPHRFEQIRTDCFGIAILSKIPLENPHVIKTQDSEIPTLVTQIHSSQGLLSIIATHPTPPVSQSLNALHKRQLATLVQTVQQQTHPTILVGDLNMSPWSAYFRPFLKDAALKNSMNGFGFQPSWPAQIALLRTPIDHLLHDPRIKIQHRFIGKEIGSDHLPLIVDLYLEND